MTRVLPMQSHKLREDAEEQLRLVDDLLRQTPLRNKKAHVLSRNGDRVGDKGDECWERLRGGEWLISAPKEEAVAEPSCAHTPDAKDRRLGEDAKHVVTAAVQAKGGIVMPESLPTAKAEQQALLVDCEQHAACATKAGWVSCGSLSPAPCTDTVYICVLAFFGLSVTKTLKPRMTARDAHDWGVSVLTQSMECQRIDR